MAEKKETTVTPDVQAPVTPFLTAQEYADLKASLEGKDREIAAFKTTVFDLEKEVNEANEKFRDLTFEVNAKDKIIAALELENAALKAEKDDAPAAPSVKVGKKTYIIAIPRFYYDGKELTAADVKNDAKLAAELVEAKSGVLVEAV